MENFLNKNDESENPSGEKPIIPKLEPENSKNDEIAAGPGTVLFSDEESRPLTDLVDKYNNMVNAGTNDIHSRRKKKEAWKNIQTELNAQNPGRFRTEQQVQDRWKYMKRTVKKEYVSAKKHKSGTGGGKAMPEMSALSNRVVDVIGRESHKYNGIPGAIASEIIPESSDKKTESAIEETLENHKPCSSSSLTSVECAKPKIEKERRKKRLVSMTEAHEAELAQRTELMDQQLKTAKAQAPSEEIEADYVNRKGHGNHSINVQAICDNHLRFLHIDCSWPGSTHDSFILRNSPVWDAFESGKIKGLVLGDSGYPLKRWLMTPLPDPTTQPEINYQISHCATRSLIERSFGVAKMRFRRLYKKIDMDLKNVPNLIVSCCILHNIARELNIPDFLPDSDDEDNQPTPTLAVSGSGESSLPKAYRQKIIDNCFA